MKTLHIYLTRQVLATLFMTVAVFTFVLLLGNALKEIMQLLINGQATLAGMLEAVGLLVPFVLVFALPMGMMTAALLVFGRFSADHELTAVRSSGISLVALVTPILLLSLILCGVSSWINLEAGPQCRVAYKNLIQEMGLKMTVAALPEGRYVREKNAMFFIGKIDGDEMQNIVICHLDTNNDFDQTATAPKGRLSVTNGKPNVTLYDAQVLERMTNGGWSTTSLSEWTFPLLSDDSKTNISRVPLRDMTYEQLQAELARLQASFSVPDARKLTADQLRKQKDDLEHAKADATMPVRVQLHTKVATSFACFGFTLVGIPLGIRAHRRETNIGLAMALALVFVYYAFIIIGESLQSRAEYVPYLIVWMPNFIFQIVGAVMLWRANKGI